MFAQAILVTHTRMLNKSHLAPVPVPVPMQLTAVAIAGAQKEKAIPTTRQTGISSVPRRHKWQRQSAGDEGSVRRVHASCRETEAPSIKHSRIKDPRGFDWTLALALGE